MILMTRFKDQHLIAAIFVSFVLVCIKKWEPGGNLDTIWYSAIAKNIALTGDFFHFFISRNWQSIVYDHMPLTYWIVGSLMKMFGISDFVARLYPMACSFASCLLVYAIGTFIKDKHFGLGALLTYALTVGSTKWNGALIHDVPLTMFILACVYGFLRARVDVRWLYLCAICFPLGILTKGPIIGGFGLAVLIWSYAEGEWYWLKTRHFLGALAVTTAILGLLFLPGLLFDGRSYYAVFYHAKIAYARSISSGWTWYFGYWDDLLKSTFLILPTLLLALPTIFVKNRQSVSFGLDSHQRQQMRLMFWLALSIIIPLSCFQVKFPHYMLPAYPAIALIAAIPVAYWLRAYQSSLPIVLKRVAIAVVCLFVMFPIKISGQRSKDEINFANMIKLDRHLQNKDVIFVGDYDDNMRISQTFKFYGSIDLKHATKEQIKSRDLANTWLVIPTETLPIERADAIIDKNSCVLINEKLCAVTDRKSLDFTIPADNFPSEIYLPLENN
jgi:4-amino-4-deoxy-L-arabinose transferase-like glycosyltransferase